MSDVLSSVYDRIESIKQSHEKEMFDKTESFDTLGDGKQEDAVGIVTNSYHKYIVGVCDEIIETIPEREPEEVRRYRAVCLSMDSVRNEVSLNSWTENPVPKMRETAIRLRDQALGIIESRLVLESPVDEEDADVIYIFDPVSKTRHTTALGGYREEYDKAMIEDKKKMLAEQILNEPLPDSVRGV